MRNFAPEINKHDDFVAQLVEQLTLNQWVESSSLSEVTEMEVLYRASIFIVTQSRLLARL